MASEAMKDVQTLQKLEQELDLELKQALEIKQALELALFKELDMMSEMTGEAKAAVQKQDKSAESNTSRLPVRTEAQSHVGGKHERECDDEAGKQVTSMQNEEINGNTKRQKK